MNKILAFSLIIFSLGACTENRPDYQLLGPTDSERSILVEEFSGALCPNCPQGTQELQNLKSIYGSSLIIVTIHAGDFAFQYDNSKFDFTTPEGDELLQFLGNPIGYPSAVVNRKRPDGQSGFQSFSSKWGSLISDEISKMQQIGLSIDINFEPSSRDLQATIVVIPFENIGLPTRLTVLIKEDNIVDPQADRSVENGKVEDYVHKNVLRTMITEFQGDLLADRLVAFDNLEKSYRYSIPDDSAGWWKVEDLSLVAFISKSNGEDIAVIQAAEKKIMF